MNGYCKTFAHFLSTHHYIHTTHSKYSKIEEIEKCVNRELNPDLYLGRVES